ncbi:succinate dehydrogenase cytochrome b subunit [Marinilongibacter aquaticus]|uniref:succinate dehydrogenase cytochrome b subunit n=1 Tax=Marinilongibacter aquaticus TaxID=2975157 RepID=UPI0021BDA4FB|nr:succinate dehydrogenase cytochrome b subunit [Marinilongibacter aquaticus]UBM57802.1 succinate dehydrogenase cytochrome b subunit [Marinilongibacter aquaticus]
MSWLTKTLSSSIGKKVLMAITGLFLCSFLVIHLVGNLQLFKDDGGYAFNTYSVFMTSNPLIKTISYVLYFSILFHAFWGIYLEYQNKKARPVGYAVSKNQGSFASKNMAILGTIILVFIAVHLSNFWYQYHFGHLPYVTYTENLASGEITAIESLPSDYSQEAKMLEVLNEQAGTKSVTVKDLYLEAETAFSHPLLVILYVISMAVLGFHLMHGFQSGFQTLGLNHPKYSPFIKKVGVWIFAILIPAAFAVMPIYFLIK